MYANITVFDDNRNQIASDKVLPMVTLTKDTDKYIEEYSFKYSVYRFRKNESTGNKQSLVFIDEIDLCDREVDNNDKS